jgi:hypothetical protein
MVGCPGMLLDLSKPPCKTLWSIALGNNGATDCGEDLCLAR